ncbi:DUF58 domain-containing protein [Clostridium algidicarnis]|uniref:DUF58 domain-containing protein n=1 Tax=Clostridium algidicarnis TaxID=37659 RepID=UPI001627E9F8|nr:DUF58 domain-containing protein [Clostridium algidicarnis]MBB6631535.1 DUF58 domain-containing protein [Clostridium algidicarnis]MBU3196223.1 DUF58 domain-containing protein [Clostridium algidicarnis]MBU3205045.1 DUF58 domain-containing protein [Clostridium algidicarnis]MBU3207155.1 DUF58 domain-containing protein [Clostridium algidicarnis]MBU3213198.1 DUF58 domain-containing protein [Clostridium algidicarnis]
MKSYAIFILAVVAFYIFSRYTMSMGFKDIEVIRSLDKARIFPGEQFNVITKIENKRRWPIAFLNIKEQYPEGFERMQSSPDFRNPNVTYYTSSYSILGHERVKRYYNSTIDKRGVYYLKYLTLSLGDLFGIFNIEEEQEDLLEVIVYPKVVDASQIEFENKSIQGDSVVRRWIFSDPVYVRGLREYVRGDRMKDIHWNSSLRMNKLVVKEYEYTSERQVVFIANVQCAKPYWSAIDGEAIEKAVKIVASLSNFTIEQGIPTGVMTNANMISSSGNFSNELLPGINNFKEILEFCARIDKLPKVDFSEFLREKGSYFNSNSIYIILTPYMNDEIISEMIKLKRYGIIMKVIDVSEKGSLPELNHIEKIYYGGKG